MVLLFYFMFLIFNLNLMLLFLKYILTMHNTTYLLLLLGNL